MFLKDTKPVFLNLFLHKSLRDQLAWTGLWKIICLHAWSLFCALKFSVISTTSSIFLMQFELNFLLDWRVLTWCLRGSSAHWFPNLEFCFLPSLYPEVLTQGFLGETTQFQEAPCRIPMHLTVWDLRL